MINLLEAIGDALPALVMAAAFGVLMHLVFILFISITEYIFEFKKYRRAYYTIVRNWGKLQKIDREQMKKLDTFIRNLK